MPVEKIDTIIVGGGQAGIAMSEHLGRRGVQHLVLERDRIAERWRTGRWDSLVANGPAWHDRFPNLTFDDVADDAFASKDRIVRYFESYVDMIGAPVRCGVAVTAVDHKAEGTGFVVRTSQGDFEARNVVSATGPFQRPIMPKLIAENSGVDQLHSADYRTPDQLRPGAVLVIGAGSSGAQIADELLRAGRQVYLAVGPHERPPRSYRGKDFCWWLGVLGHWDETTRDVSREHVTISVSGARGGHTVDFREFASRGMTLLGKVQGYSNGSLAIAPDLGDNLRNGDASYLSILDEADAYVTAHGHDLPEEPAARRLLPDPDCVTNPVLDLDLAQAGITSVIWATGYALDYGWLNADVFDGAGKPVHRKGVSGVPGIYFIGLAWLTRRASPFIWGVWHDADALAQHILERNASNQESTRAEIA